MEGRTRWGSGMYLAVSVTIGLYLQAVVRGAKRLSLRFTPINTKSHVAWGIPRTRNAFVGTGWRSNYIAGPQFCTKHPQGQSEKTHFGICNRQVSLALTYRNFIAESRSGRGFGRKGLLGSFWRWERTGREDEKFRYQVRGPPNHRFIFTRTEGNSVLSCRNTRYLTRRLAKLHVIKREAPGTTQLSEPRYWCKPRLEVCLYIMDAYRCWIPVFQCKNVNI